MASERGVRLLPDEQVGDVRGDKQHQRVAKDVLDFPEASAVSTFPSLVFALLIGLTKGSAWRVPMNGG